MLPLFWRLPGFWAGTSAIFRLPVKPLRQNSLNSAPDDVNHHIRVGLGYLTYRPTSATTTPRIPFQQFLGCSKDLQVAAVNGADAECLHRRRSQGKHP